MPNESTAWCKPVVVPEWDGFQETALDVKQYLNTPFYLTLLEKLQKLQLELKLYSKIKEDDKYVGFDAYKDAIKDADVVILATPPGFRPYHLEECINQGKHVFCEKPLATDAAGIRKCLDLVKVSEQKKLNIVVGLQRHYQTKYREIMGVLPSNKRKQF